jgi:hypothetical protein
MKVKNIVSEEFKVAVRKLSDGSYSLETAIKLRDIITSLEFYLNQYETQRKALLDKYALKDDKGGYVTNEAGNAIFAEGDDKKFYAEVEVLLEKDVEVDKLKPKEFGIDTKVTLRELSILSPILKQ